jgi:hypothetical protein
MFELLKPIIIFFIISISISFFFSGNILEFFKYFLFVSIIQFILGRIYISIMQLFAEKIKNERIKEYTKQGMEITCPCYLDKKMLLPIDLNSVNNFKCLECSKDFTVDITAKTFLKTESIDLDKADAAFIEVVKKIQSYE